MPSYLDSLAGAANVFVPLDPGLAAISAHAKRLGYQWRRPVLDELVLWLAGKIGDPAFVAWETEKVAKARRVVRRVPGRPHRQLHRPPARPP